MSHRGRREPLSRDRVLNAAIELADESGLESLTMRRLGSRLGVEAMSLYKHVGGKEDMLDGMVDLVIGQIELPAADGDWKTAMRLRALSARRVLAEHPWAIGMLESRKSIGPASATYVDAVIGSLRAGGFSVEMAAYAFLVLDSYIYGFVVQESTLPFDPSEEDRQPAEETLEAIAGGAYPHLMEMATAHLDRDDPRYAHVFEFGLDLILDGLERLGPQG